MSALKQFLAREKVRTYGFIAIFLGPIVLYYIVFLFYPLISSFIWTFFHYNPVATDNRFAGFENYQRLLNDPLVSTTLINTLLLAVYIVPVGVFLALLVALGMNRLSNLGRAVFTTAYFIPVITSIVAAAAVWMWLFHPARGLLNYGLMALGLSPVRWLTNAASVKPSLAIFSIWRSVGFNAVIFLAALKGIPDDYYDAARIDGAAGWRMTVSITLPLLRPAFLFVLVTSIISVMQIFTEVYVMTGGGPVHASRVMAMYIYERGIRYLEMGYASTLAYVLFAIVMIITVIQWRVLRTNWDY